MKFPLRTSAVCGRATGWLLAGALALLVPIGCGDGEGASSEAEIALEKASARTFGSRKGLNNELVRLVTASQTGTIVGRTKLGDEQVLHLKAPPEYATAFGTPKPVPLNRVSPGTVPGEVMTTTGQIPAALAVAADGTVFYGADGHTWRVDKPGAKPEEVFAEQAIVLQFHPRSGELLLQAGRHTYLAAAPDYALVRPLPEPLPEGRAQWEPGRADSLLFFREYIDFNASNPDRIFLKIQRQSTDGLTREPVAWLTSIKLAEAGTLPAAGAVWGHMARRYQIRPQPAPIVLMTDEASSNTLTSPGRASDISPVASSDGAFYWVRTWRRGSTTGRPFMQLPRAPAVPIATAATDLVSVSTQGDWLVLALRDGKGSRLVRMDRDTRRKAAEAAADVTDPSATMREAAEVLDQGMKLELRRLGRWPDLVKKDYGWILVSAPDRELVLTLGDRFRERLEREFSVTLSPGLTGLMEADTLLDEIAPFLDENPWMVLGIAGLYARALPEDRVRWLIRSVDNGLGQDVSTESSTDGLSLTATSPFYIARERLTNDLSLAEAAKRLLQDNPGPTFLVENLSGEVMRLALLDELRRADVDTTVTAVQLHDLLRDKPPSAAVSLLALRAARDVGDQDLALLAGWRLAQARPHSGKALGRLAQPLKDAGLMEEALLLLNQAVALEPLNPDLRFSLADLLTMLDRLPAARAEYLRALAADTDGTFAQDVADRLRLLDEMEGKPGS